MGNSEPTGRDLVPGFASVVASVREEAGMSRRELADAAGLSFNTVYAIESERRAPSLRVAVAIADALEIPLGDLLLRAKSAPSIIGDPSPEPAPRPAGKRK